MVIPTERMAIPKVATMATTAIKVPGDPFDRRFFRFGDSVFQPRFRPFEVGAAGGFAVDLRVGGARDLVRMRARDSGGGHFFAGFERVHRNDFITARAFARRLRGGKHFFGAGGESRHFQITL